MNITPYSDINPLIEELLANIQAIFKEKLVGLYLHGSLVLGDFDPNSSDIDLLAALSADVSDPEFEQLQQMHQGFAVRHPQWNDRVEVCYISVDALKSVKSRTSPIVNISPGEPIHRLEADQDWLLHWYQARERSKILLGPPPQTVIEPISKDEFIEGVKDHVRNWDRWVQDAPHNRYALAYVILTLCRALYSVKTGEQVSKKRAADWAQQEIPAWSGFIQQAVQWKKEGRTIALDESGFQKTVEFVYFVQRLILET